MAMSSTTACMPHYREIIPKSKPTNIFPVIPCSKTTTYTNTTNYNDRIAFRKTPNVLRFIGRSSGESASSTSETATASTETWEGGDSDSVEVAKGPPSLISALNVEKAFRGIAITDVDHYGRLGLRKGCSYELVGVAYQNKVKELSGQELDDEKLNEELDRLKESFRILSSEEERRLYDWSLARVASPDRYSWPFEGDITQIAVKGTPPPQEPEDVGPTIAVGYFFLGWMVLACILSPLLNQL